MGTRMNEQVARNNVYYPGGFANIESDPSTRQPTWLERRLSELGAIEMAPSTKPPGFYVNWTTVTSLIVVVSAIAGLWWFTWQTAEQRGIEKGRIEAEKQQMQRQIDEQARKLADNEKLLKLAVQQQEK